MTENTSPNLPHQFQKGQSGNPAGKPKGARHKTTLLAERLMQDDAERIVNAVITAACNGDMTAAKIILDRICPPRRSRPFHLPAIERDEDSLAAKQESRFGRLAATSFAWAYNAADHISRARQADFFLWYFYEAPARCKQDGRFHSALSAEIVSSNFSSSRFAMALRPASPPPSPNS